MNYGTSERTRRGLFGMESDIDTSHLEAARVDDARRARDAVVAAARAWASASKQHAGAVTLPGDLPAARAFGTLHEARSALAYHVGGEVAAQYAAVAVSTAYHELAARS
jgi:outer membrane PBP1 activator LpoA protein